MLQVLRTALGDAERKGLVSRNVARFMDPPCHGIAPEQRCWDDAHLRAFLKVAAEHRFGPALWLTAMTGMRRGEVLGLSWSDIDLEAERLSVQRSVTCTGYQVHTTATKTRTSRRAIDLDQTFDRVQVNARPPRIRLHDLRHTHATLLLKAGVPLKVVSERLGHSSPAFTMAVYQHVLPGMQREAARIFARLMAEPNPEVPVSSPGTCLTDRVRYLSDSSNSHAVLARRGRSFGVA